MELDLLNSPVDLKKIPPREMEEAFEDPFLVRFMPDEDRADGESRAYALGRSVGGRHLFLCFTADGKKARVVAAREMTPDEQMFYDRKYAEGS